MSDSPNQQSGAGAEKKVESPQPSPVRPEDNGRKEHERLEKSALQKLEVARTISLNANKTFLLYSISLLLFWLQGVSSTVQILSEIGPAFTNRQQLQASVSRSNSLSAFQERRQNVIEAQAAIDKVLNNIPKATKLPGGFELPIPPVYAPFVWCVLCAVLLLYVNYCRRRHFTLMARGLRILKQEMGYSPKHLSDVCPALPWWLAPLPSKDGPCGLTSDELHRAAGWISERRRISGFGVLAVSFYLAVQFGTLAIAWASFATFLSDPWWRFLMLQLTALVLAVTILCAFDWLRPARVPDHLAENRNPNRWDRRHLLGAVAFTAVADGVYPVRNLWRSLFPPQRPKQQVTAKAQALRVAPRFRKKKRPQPPAVSGLPAHTAFVNGKSDVIHYVASATTPSEPCIRGIPAAKLASFAQSSLPDALRAAQNAAPGATNAPGGAGVRAARSIARTPRRQHLHDSCASWAAENAAETLFAQGRAEEACRLVLTVLQTRPYDLRLYDRVAAASITSKLPEIRKQLIDLARRAIGARQIRIRKQPESIFVRLVRRFIGEYEEEKIAPRRRERRHCRAGVRTPRNHGPGAGGHSRDPVDALEQRIRKWENPQSRWRRKWAGDRQWSAPAPSRACKA